MRKWAYIMVALVFIVVTGVALWEATRQRELVYQGKPLSYWVRHPHQGAYLWRMGPPVYLPVPDLPTPDSSAIPLLMRYLENPQHPFGPFYTKAWQRLPVWLQRHLPQPGEPETIRFNAIEMLHRMGPAAKPAIPALIQILREEQDPWMWRGAARVLEQFALEEPSVKALLDDLGRKFRTKSTHHRIEDGQRVHSLLPSCTKTQHTDVVMERIAYRRSIMASDDFSAPSYRLSKEQLFGILGQPDDWDNGTAVYRLGRYTNSTSFYNGSQCYLYIQLADGYVHQSMVWFDR